jgi:hypothetical protein
MKDDLPYFTHDNNASQHPKMKALIAEYGFEGYGRFWALNEKIARNSGACIDISRKVYKLDLANELRLNSDELDKFLAFLSEPDIDLINVIDGKITTDRINELYQSIMGTRENSRNKKAKKGKGNFPEGKEDFPEGKEDFPEGKGESLPKKTTNKIKENKIKQDNNKINNNDPPKEKPIGLLSREPKNDIERVNKKWLENYIAIHGEQPINPRWDISSSLVSKAIKQVGVEKVLQSLDTAKDDSFCLQSGYILKIIMSGCVISRLINKPTGAGPPKELAKKKKFIRA